MAIIAQITDFVSGILASHWSVVFIGLAFLAMQLYLCLRFFYRMRRHELELAKLQGDLEAGGDGRDIELLNVLFRYKNQIPGPLH